jgi:hypothetical protein
MNPNITILLLTYCKTKERTDYAMQTIQGLRTNLCYDGKWAWYIADGFGDRQAVSGLMKSLENQRIIGWHSELLTPGANWNRGLVECYKHSDYILVMEDDWLLPELFDIAPYVQLLNDLPTVGMVRFGTLTLGMICHVKGHAGRHYLEMDHGPQYAFSGNPHLRHKRLNRAIGLYNEDITPSPGDVEIDFDYRFRQQNDIKIWRPADLSGYGVFSHIGALQSYEVD